MILKRLFASIFSEAREPVPAQTSSFPGIPLRFDVPPGTEEQLPEISLEVYEKLNPRCEIVHNGVTVGYATPNGVTRWRVDSLFSKEPVTIDWIDSFQEGDVLVDVGANVGMYSILAAKTRGVRVYAFEPEAQNYALLNRNIQMNDLSGGVSAYCLAISDQPGFSELHLAALHAGGSCHSFGEAVDFNHQPMKPAFSQGCVAATLDELVERGVIRAPQHIKIDVDGFENKVIAGAARTLQGGSVQSLLIEVNPNLEDHRLMVSTLNRMGFAHDPAQVAAAERKSGAFRGMAEYLFKRHFAAFPASKK